MSQFDIQDKELFQMVNENHRRNNMTTVIGYIVPADQARKFAAYEAAKDRKSGIIGLLIPVFGLLATAVITVIAFI